MKNVIVAIAIASTFALAQAAPVNSVSYASLSGGQIVDFDDLPAAGSSGTNYDTTFVSHGVAFGERFAGQSLSYSGDFDILGNTASNTLSVIAGESARNTDLLSYNGSNVLTGLGNLGYPDFNAVGEGSFAGLFSSDQSQFGFQLVGGNGGDAFVSFFKRDGSLISTMTISNLADGYYGFSRAGDVQDIAGISIYNTDLGGIGFDNLKHDVASNISAVPEPETYAMLLAGLGIMGVVARRRKAAQV